MALIGLVALSRNEALAWESTLYPKDWEPGFADSEGRFLHDFSYAGYHRGEIPIPKDVLVARSFSADAKAVSRRLDEVRADEMILDIGPLTAADYAEIIHGAGTVIWNGPVGVFEFRKFAAGTRSVFVVFVRSHAFSIAGGGALTLNETDPMDVKPPLTKSRAS